MDGCHAPSFRRATPRRGSRRSTSRRTRPRARSRRIDATVWAFSDIHGVRSGLLAALVEAGIADIDGAWIAPPGTALVGLGDYIDRGTDSAGLVALLASLQREASAAGSRVVLVRGNHEQMLIDVLLGDEAWATGLVVEGWR